MHKTPPTNTTTTILMIDTTHYTSQLQLYAVFEATPLNASETGSSVSCHSLNYNYNYFNSLSHLTIITQRNYFQCMRPLPQTQPQLFQVIKATRHKIQLQLYAVFEATTFNATTTISCV